MYERKTPPNLACGLDLIAEVLYGKWKIRLLFFINGGHQRPSELQRKIPDATRRVLSMQLNELERHGLVFKEVYAEIPLRVEYSLTEIGKSLVPLISNLGQWADDHEDHLREVIMKKY